MLLAVEDMAKYQKPRVKAPTSKEYWELEALVSSLRLKTVCQEASCPNIGECWSKKHLTLMIMGDTCTRACAFCDVKTGKPQPLDVMEPERVAEMVGRLNLSHVVITSVDRDDLVDGGARHFQRTIASVREKARNTTVEILTPDFLRKDGALEIVLQSPPDVFNHNLETVPSLYKKVRPGARYYNSLRLLHKAKLQHPNLFTKSGIMLGLGEKKEEVFQVMEDMRCAEVDFLTLGQYLSPSPTHYPVVEYVKDEVFQEYKEVALAKGFLMVASSPLTRSSYHADEHFQELRKLRQDP